MRKLLSLLTVLTITFCVLSCANLTEVSPDTVQNAIIAAEGTVNLTGCEIETGSSIEIVKSIIVTGGDSQFDFKGSVVTVKAAGTVLKNAANISELIVDESVGDRDFTVSNCEIAKLTVKGGGANSIHIENAKITAVTVAKNGVRFVLEGETAVASVDVQTACTFDSTSSTAVISAVNVAASVPAITVQGKTNLTKITAASTDFKVAINSNDVVITSACVQTSDGKVSAVKVEAAEGVTKTTVPVPESLKDKVVEETKKEEVKKDETKKEEVKKEDVKTEEQKKEEKKDEAKNEENKEPDLSKDYITPEIFSISMSLLDENRKETTAPLKNGGFIVLTVEALSNTPIEWINYMWKSPTEVLEGGGYGVTCTKIKDKYWSYQRTYNISKYKISGEYKWTISVRNSINETSESKTVTLEVINDAFSSEKPIIKDISLSSDKLDSGNGGIIKLTLTAESAVPLNWINLCLDGPNRNITGGGGGTSFISSKDNEYIYEQTWSFSKWAENGIYTFSNISVANEAGITSNIYEPKTFEILNNTESSKPVIESIKMVIIDSNTNNYNDLADINNTSISVNNLEENLCIALIIDSNSEAPISFYCSSFFGPDGNITGGGGGISATEISNSKWRIILGNTIRNVKLVNKGKYYFSDIQVENESRKQSEIWSTPLEFTLTD